MERCSRCQEELQAGAIFCSNCGTRRTNPAPASGHQSPVRPAFQPQQPTGWQASAQSQPAPKAQPQPQSPAPTGSPFGQNQQSAQPQPISPFTGGPTTPAAPPVYNRVAVSVAGASVSGDVILVVEETPAPNIPGVLKFVLFLLVVSWIATGAAIDPAAGIRALLPLAMLVAIPVALALLFGAFFPSLAGLSGGCMNVLTLGLLSSVAAGRNAAGATGRRRDLVMTVREDVTDAIMTVRLARAGLNAAIPTHSHVSARGRMRGAVLWASSLDIDSGRGVVTLRSGGAVSAALFWVFFAMMSLSVMGNLLTLASR